ncbi:MAG: Rpp14/Pop5 family protein [Sulfolobales archaeon]
MNKLGADKKARKRYLVFKLYTIGSSPDFETLSKEINDSLTRFLGVSGFINSSIKLVRYDPLTRYGVIRIISRDIDLVLLGIIRIRRFNNTTGVIVPLRLTGNLSRAIKLIKKLER